MKHKREMIIIVDGRLKLEGNQTSFGYPLWRYLSNWQKACSIPNGTQVRILTEEHFQDLVARAQMPSIG